MKVIRAEELKSNKLVVPAEEATTLEDRLAFFGNLIGPEIHNLLLSEIELSKMNFHLYLPDEEAQILLPERINQNVRLAIFEAWEKQLKVPKQNNFEWRARFEKVTGSGIPSRIVIASTPVELNVGKWKTILIEDSGIELPIKISRNSNGEYSTTLDRSDPKKMKFMAKALTALSQEMGYIDNNDPDSEAKETEYIQELQRKDEDEFEFLNSVISFCQNNSNQKIKLEGMVLTDVSRLISQEEYTSYNEVLAELWERRLRFYIPSLVDNSARFLDITFTPDIGYTIMETYVNGSGELEGFFTEYFAVPVLNDLRDPQYTLVKVNYYPNHPNTKKRILINFVHCSELISNINKATQAGNIINNEYII